MEIDRNLPMDRRLGMLLRAIGFYRFHHKHPMVQDSILVMLAENGPMTQKDIQQQLQIKPGSCSELITKLESKQLLLRERDEHDHRRVVIRLTERGRSTARLLRTGSPTEPFAVLSPAEQEQLAEYLERLLQNWTGEEVTP